MAQPKDILRFRARLRSRGYSSISIGRYISKSGQWIQNSFGQPLYLVSLVEPLFGYQVVFSVSVPEMNNWPGIEFSGYVRFMKQESLFE